MAYDEHHEHDEYPTPEGGLYASTSAAGTHLAARRRRQLVAAITGGVAVVAGAGFVVTQLMNEQQPSLPEPAALAPQTTPVTAVSTPEETVPVSRTPRMRHAAPVELSPVPSLDASRQASPDAAEAAASAALDELRERLRLSERTKVTEQTYEDGTTRIVAAWRDTSDESLLRRAKDAGTPAGNGARCTTEIRNEPDLALGRPPTLMCWRTSTFRSVVVVTSATKGAAAIADCVLLIDTEWPKPD
ncbi:hypothetical protein [Actinoplanes subglobosus]|uniref:Uncharacterized protein n=1 Tax=Actinoplanes subglobosus TaxID=1547892 RepID=A0ABV8INV5_9ACTN